MEEIINVKGISVPVQIIRTNRKTCNIQIHPDSRVIVRAPLHMKTDEIENMLKSHIDAIEKYVLKCLENKKKLNRQENSPMRIYVRWLKKLWKLFRKGLVFLQKSWE